jgi:hypothetical protein
MDKPNSLPNRFKNGLWNTSRRALVASRSQANRWYKAREGCGRHSSHHVAATPESTHLMLSYGSRRSARLGYCHPRVTRNNNLFNAAGMMVSISPENALIAGNAVVLAKRFSVISPCVALLAAELTGNAPFPGIHTYKSKSQQTDSMLLIRERRVS